MKDKGASFIHLLINLSTLWLACSAVILISMQISLFKSNLFYYNTTRAGEIPKWLKGWAWKAHSGRNASKSSNLFLSAIKILIEHP